MNTEKLTGKVIVITGAASGMGAAMAKDFSAREAKVAILDMNEEKAQEVIKEIEAAGGVATFYKTDITNKTQIETAASDVEEKFGPITSWVNSAGVSKMLPFLVSTHTWPPLSKSLTYQSFPYLSVPRRFAGSFATPSNNARLSGVSGICPSASLKICPVVESLSGILFC